MNANDLMLESLTELLQEGETLMYPIYGILQQGNKQYNAFFGLTEDQLLIAVTRGRWITYTYRVPLDIRSVRLKEHWTQKNYTIDISFHAGGPCRIKAFFKVLGIDTQEDNLTMFMDVLEKRATVKDPISLTDVEGKRIRWQYFNFFIYAELICMLMVLPMLFVMKIRDGDFSLSFLGELGQGVFGVAVMLSPFVFLSVLNRFLFGKVICVLNKDGIHLENDMIPWERIKKIEYHPEIVWKSSPEYTYASLTIEEPKVEEYQIDVLHFPVYGLRIAKKLAPQVKIELSKKNKTFLAFIILTPILLGVILPFVL